MKNIIKVSAIIASLFATSAFANDCGEVLFSGLTANHKKEVRVCVFSSGGQNYIQYRFGKVSQKPEIEVIRPAKYVSYEFIKGYDGGYSTMEIANGAYVYEVSSATNYGRDEEEPGTNGSVTVTHKDKQIAVVKLDGNTVTSNIWWETGDYGMYNTSEQKFSEEFKLAPPLTK